MARASKSGGENADTFEVSSGTEPVNATPKGEVEDFFSSLGSGDVLQIERTSPIGEGSGWLSNVPWDASLDLTQEIARAYGGGTYLIRYKRKSQDGRIMFSRGSATLRIAGEPKSSAPKALVPVTPPFYPQPLASTGDELQRRLLDMLTAQLGAKNEQLPDLVAKIVETVGGRPSGSAVDPIAQLLASVTMGKQIAAALAPPSSASGAGRRDNPDDDDDDDDGADGSPLERLAMAALGKFMSQPAPAPSPAPAPMQGPPGWVLHNGEWRRRVQHVQGPPGWFLHNGRWVQDSTTVGKGGIQVDGTGPHIELGVPGTRSRPRTVLVPDGWRQDENGRVVKIQPSPKGWRPVKGGAVPPSRPDATIRAQRGNMGGLGGVDGHTSAPTNEITACRACGPGGEYANNPEACLCGGSGAVRIVNPKETSPMREPWADVFSTISDEKVDEWRGIFGTLSPYLPPAERLDNPGDPTTDDDGDEDGGHAEAMAGLLDHTRRAGPEVCDDDDLEEEDEEEDEACQACGGNGYTEADDDDGNTVSSECEVCEGTGVEMGPEFTPQEMADEVAAMSRVDRDNFLRALAPTFGLDPEMVVALAKSASDEAAMAEARDETGLG